MQESLRKGKWVGALVILGHAIVEVFVFLLLVFGFLSFLLTPDFTKAVSIIGGASLILMAVRSLKDINSKIEVKIKYSGLKAGVLLSKSAQRDFYNPRPQRPRYVPIL